MECCLNFKNIKTEVTMINQKDKKFYQFSDKVNDFSKSVHCWLAQYDEEDDFLCGKISNPQAEFIEEE